MGDALKKWSKINKFAEFVDKITGEALYTSPQEPRSNFNILTKLQVKKKMHG